MNNMQKIVLVNELDPFLHPGAASVAFNFAKEIAQVVKEVEFWTTVEEAQNIEIGDEITIKFLKIPISRSIKLKQSYKYRLFSEFINIRSLIWFFKELKNSKPDIIWLHQFGFRFPKTIILICKIYRIPTYATLHDFNLILPRKLYPSDLNLNEYQFNFTAIDFKKQKGYFLKNSSEGLFIRIYYNFRQWLLRLLFNSIQGVFTISELQAEIFSSFGFRSSATIQNGFYPCKCKVTRKIEKSILFAGRDIGKGLDKVINAVQNSGWHLHLAGDARLHSIASSHLAESEFTYHGNLSQVQLFSLIHRMCCVAVLSQCFDVFPSIAYESIVHGSLPLITKTSGNSGAIARISQNLIIPLGQSPNLDRIYDCIDIFFSSKNIDIEILTPRDSTEIYLKHFSQFKNIYFE